MQTHYERILQQMGSENERVAHYLKILRAQDPDVPLSQVYQRLITTYPQKTLAADLAGNKNIVSMLLSESGDYYDYEYLFAQKEAAQFARDMAHWQVELLGRAGIEVEHAAVEKNLICGINVNYYVNAYEQSGKQTYRVSDGLALQLQYTELRGLRGEDMRLPYRALYLEIPAILNFKLLDSDTGYHKVSGIYMVEDYSDTSWYPLVDRKFTPEQMEGRHSWRLMICGDPNEKSTSPSDDAIKFFGLKFRKGLSVSDTLADLCLSMKRTEELAYAVFSEDDWAAVWHWVLNAIFYATNPEAERDTIIANPQAQALWNRMQKLAKGSPKREKLKDQFRKMDQRSRVLLGRSVHLDRNLKEYHEQSSTHERRALLVRSFVAGHWQRYAVGKGRTERVPKFRKCFFRGPKDADLPTQVIHQLGKDELKED